MALPVQVTVTGTVYEADTLTPYTGPIQFIAPFHLRHADGTVIMPGTITAQIVNGALSVQLMAVDSPGWAPQDWSYQVRLREGYRWRSFNFRPSVADTVVNLGELVPAGYVPDAGEEYVTQVQLDTALSTVGGGSGGGTATWTSVTGKPSTFPPSAHTHVVVDVTGLQAILDAKADLAATATALAGKAATVHTHAQGDVTGLTAALTAKADAAATTTALGLKADASAVATSLAAKADTTALTSGLAGKADTTALTAGLAAKADTTALAAKADTTALTAGLAAKADTTALTSGLAGKADTTALTSGLAGKADLVAGVVPTGQLPVFTATVNGYSGTVVLAKSDVGLGNVTNTSDANKPVSTAQQAALDAKAPLASPTFTGTVAGISKSMVGLGSVDNTADTAKPVSTAQQTALDAKQPIIKKWNGSAYVVATGAEIYTGTGTPTSPADGSIWFTS